MGLLTASFGGVKIPVKIINLNRNLTPTIENKTQTLGNSNGSFLVHSNYKENTITIEYAIENGMASDLSKFRRDTAGIIYSKKEKNLVFSDEPNIYYKAILTGQPTLLEEHSRSSGALTFLVPDGVSHSTIEKTFKAVLNSSGVMETTIVNGGSEEVPIDYIITHKHENGFIGIVSEHGAIQLGYKDEVDKEQRTKSQVLFDYRSPSDFNAMASGEGILGFDYPKNGTWRTVSANGRQWLALDGIGSGASWHGASKMVTIPNDSSGSFGASEFFVQGKLWFETGLTKQTGMMALSIGDENGQHLAGIRVAKYDLGQNLAAAMIDVQGSERKRITFIPSWDGCTASDKGHIYIKKNGDMFEFYFGGGKYQVREAAAKSKKAKTVTIFIGQHGTVPSSLVVTRMYWDYVFFRKENVNYWVDIPNRYGDKSIIYIDGNSTEVFVDGIIRMEDEITGSEYFRAPPGETKVQFFYSDFASPPPEITAKIREAYL